MLLNLLLVSLFLRKKKIGWLCLHGGVQELREIAGFVDTIRVGSKLMQGH